MVKNIEWTKNNNGQKYLMDKNNNGQK